MTTNSIDLSPRLHINQAEIWPDLISYRYGVLVAGRRWGKGEIAAERLRYAALTDPGPYAYIAPSYRMAKRIEWPKLKRRFPREVLRVKPNESELTISPDLPDCSITCYGADNPDSLRGIDRGFKGVVMDEYEQFKPDLWDAVIRPMLADYRGWALFIGTPSGYGQLYDMWTRGHSLDRKRWKSWQYKSIDNPLIDPREIEEARRECDPRLYRQEWEASFETPAGAVYDDFDRTINVRPCPSSDKLPIRVGMDFNIDPMALVLYQIHGREWWVVDSVEIRGAASTDKAVKWLDRWMVAHYGNAEWERARNASEIICDPSGNARQHNLGTSSVQLIRSAGWSVHFKHVTEEADKWNALRALVLNADDERRLYIDPRNKRLIERLEQLAPDDDDDHLTDAAAYPAHYYKTVWESTKRVA